MIFISLVPVCLTPLVLIGNLFFGIRAVSNRAVTIFSGHRVTGTNARIIGFILIVGGFLGLITFSIGGLLALMIGIGIGLTAKTEPQITSLDWDDQSKVVMVGNFTVDPDSQEIPGREGMPNNYGIENVNTDVGQTRRFPPEQLQATRSSAANQPAVRLKPGYEAQEDARQPAAPIVPPPPARSLPDTWMRDAPELASPGPSPSRPEMQPARPNTGHGAPAAQPIGQPVRQAVEATKPAPAARSEPVRTAQMPLVSGQHKPAAALPDALTRKSGARLRVVKGELSVSEVFVEKDEFIIGRGRTADLQLLDPKVSREHARLRLGGDKWYIQDRKSTSGIKVNGTRIKAIQLQPGDRIEILNYMFVFDIV